MIEILNEIHRPKKIKDMIKTNFDYQYFENIIRVGKIDNHILLYGKPGIGKSTIIKILMSELQADYIYINASLETGVDNIKTKVISFCSIKNFANKVRVVWLEECDRLSSQAWDALKAIFEDFSKNVKIVGTCNNPEKLSDPILSRFQKFEFKPLLKEDCIPYLKKILEKEKIIYKDKDLDTLWKFVNGDMRDCINTLQQNVKNKKLELTSVDNLLENFFVVYKKKDLRELQKFLSSNNINYDFLFRLIYEYTANIDKIIIIANYMKNRVIDDEINFVAMICELWKIKDGK